MDKALELFKNLPKDKQTELIAYLKRLSSYYPPSLFEHQKDESKAE